MTKITIYFSWIKTNLVFTKYIAFVCLMFGFVSNASADSVHLGLKIHYKTAMSHVEKKDLPVIEMLRRLSVVLPDAKFLIAGHTDTVGSYQINVELSRGRANTVKLLMVHNGVNGDRIETKWFSYDAPIASNDTEEGRAQNRRTVATVYNLTPSQAQQLVRAANKSKRFYVIKTESDKVDEYVAEVLEPEIKPEERQDSFQGVEENTVVHAENQAEKKMVVNVPEGITTVDAIDDMNSSEVTEEEDSELTDADMDDTEIKEEPVAPKVEEKKIVEKKPVVEKKKKESKPPSNKHRYFVSWALTDNELVAKRTAFEAIMVTDFNHNISLGYQYKITSKYWLGASGTYRLQKYRILNNPIFTWDEVTPNLIHLAVNLDYQPDKKWALGLDVNYSEESFVVSQGLNVHLQKVGMFGVSGRGLYRFYDSASMSSRVKAALELPLFGSDDIDPKGKFGFLLGADLSLKKLMKSHEVNFGIYYGIRNFETFQNSQTETHAGFEIKFRNKLWP